MKKLIFLGILFIGSINTSSAQITINEDAVLTQMIERDKEINKNTEFISGWCVQLMATDSRSKVTTMKGDFLTRYPNINVDWHFENPHYKLRAGAFLNKIEAYRLLFIIRTQYPDAYIAQTNKIRPRDLL